MLRILGLAESTYYERKKRAREEKGQPREPSSSISKGRPYPGYSETKDKRKVSDEQIKEWLMELIEGEEVIYGYKRLALCLRKDKELDLNNKKAYRLCKELGILQKQRKPKAHHPRRLPRNRTITGRNQLWQMDIKYGYVKGRDRFFFTLSIIDVFDRVIVGYYRGPVCEAKQACQTLLQALHSRWKPGEPLPDIRTDNGPQFVSKLFGETVEGLGMHHERIPPKTPNMNAYIESFHSLMERDLMEREEFMTMEEAYGAIDRYMDFYNHRRMHSSLKNMSPAKFSVWVLGQEDCSKFHRAV